MPKVLFFGRYLLFMAGMLYALSGARADDTYDRTAAVIFTYQRIGEDLTPATNVSMAQFESHLDELTGGEYHIATLDEIVAALKAGTKLPDRTVAITFDGAYKSALQNAIPLLLDREIPFTVFFSPNQAAADTPDYMNWDDLKRLARSPGVTLGLHPADYTRLTGSDSTEIRRQINNALSLTRDRLKLEPRFFAYPFGEYSKSYREAVTEAGFTAAFGQQSGVAWSGADLYALPRFAMTESYADDDRFRMAATALPLPVSDVTPDDPHITAPNPPGFGFTLEGDAAAKLAQMSCFISEQGKPEIEKVGRHRVELRVRKPFEDDRVRVNCTMPGPAPKPGEDQRWRWFGMLLSVGSEDVDNVDD